MATKQQQNDFINQIAPIIKSVGNARGYYVVSPVIAQACKESGYNTSGLSKKYMNYFGMKAGKSWKGKVVNLKTKEEYTVGKLTTITDGFRVYDSMQKGVEGYFDFISTTRYKNLKSCKTPLEYLNELKRCGYATSSTYVSSCMDYINRHNLTAFDGKTIAKQEVAQQATQQLPVLSLGMSDAQLGNKPYIESWQNYLSLLGLYKGSQRGYFDHELQTSVKMYQMIKGLKSDGIIGKNTWATIPSAR